jgi:large-conductance mechanosensitive channel
MKGALVFLAIFAILFLATLAYSELPPGGMIYDSFNFPTTTYKLFDTLPVRTIVNSVINGLIYGIIVWIIYAIAERASKRKTKPKPQASQQQTPPAS